MVSNFLAILLEAVYPNYCFLCKLRSYSNLPLCKICQHQLRPVERSCSRCALPFSNLQLSNVNTKAPVCGHCLSTDPPLSRIIAPWVYEEHLGYLLHRWKYQGEHRLTALLAHLWNQRVDVKLNTPDVIVPVPLHWRKFLRRGWNQSELLAIEMRRQNKQLGTIKIDTQLVQRHKPTAPQATLSARQRKTNMLGAFTVRRRCDNLRLAIIDDVLTTGATAEALATALLDAGADSVELWCIARTEHPQD